MVIIWVLLDIHLAVCRVLTDLGNGFAEGLASRLFVDGRVVGFGFDGETSNENFSLQTSLRF